MGDSSMHPTTLASRDLPNEMFYDEPRVTQEPCSTTPDKIAKTPEIATNCIPLSTRGTLGAKPLPREVPTLSKYSVSPFALTAALKRYSDELASPSASTEIDREEALRRYKQARVSETEARIFNASVLRESGPLSGHHGYDKKPSIENSDATAASEGTYWKEAFGQEEKRSYKVVTEGTSHSARRLIFEYGRRIGRSEQRAMLNPPAMDARSITALPLRTRTPGVMSGAEVPADSSSDDEGFTMVHIPRKTFHPSFQSPMSSPELVPGASIAQTMADDMSASDDDWTML